MVSVLKLVRGSWRAFGRSSLDQGSKNLLVHDTFARDVASKC